MKSSSEGHLFCGIDEVSSQDDIMFRIPWLYIYIIYKYKIYEILAL